jgi:hypothetical protein
MNENRRERKIREKKYAVNEDEVLPYEKWLVSFKRSYSVKDSEQAIFVRQFYAPGFYEAYDMVATYAEKSNVDILWFKEKQNCADNYISNNYPALESFCTYCNRKFNHIDPIPCIDDYCYAEFCSKKCTMDHYKMKHKQ